MKGNVFKSDRACKQIPGSNAQNWYSPVIDGRRRGKESLEDQTMNMAKAAAKLISENIRHSNGETVECVIADTCIGGWLSARCAENSPEGVGVS